MQTMSVPQEQSSICIQNQGSYCSTSDSAAIAAAMLRLVLQAVDASAASLFFRNETTQQLELAYFMDTECRCVHKAVESDSCAEWVMRFCSPLCVHDMHCDRRFTDVLSCCTAYSPKKIAAVPVMCNFRCIGVLEAADKKNGKPFDSNDIAVLSNAASCIHLLYRVQNAELCRESRYAAGKTYTDSGIIAESPVMREKFALCNYFASSSVPILITGENGTGKKVFAYRLYSCSNRAMLPFVHIRCAELDPAALHTVLFGDGSSNENCFARSGGGTVFLDEIAAIPFAMQSELLPMLNQYVFRKNSETDTASVRLIASTEKNLERLAADCVFLPELYYSLSAMPIFIPPLSSRIEDIIPLAQLFLKQYAQEIKKAFSGFSDDALECIKKHRWKGNIRGLKNAVERACITGTPPIITQEDILPRNNLDFIPPNSTYTMKTAVDFFKRYYILSILEQNAWNKSASAAALGIQRTYLSRLLHELEIQQ